MSAYLSEDRVYRYLLTRSWGRGPAVYFIGLNPSTADEESDDPTIRRCVGFAKSWGFDSMVMTNLFAFRATLPQDMKAAPDPIGPENDIILQALGSLGTVVAAWGTDGGFKGRDRQVRAMVPNLHVLRLTKDGHPAHPLYLPANLTPVSWS
jgi:hypothetical protein